MRLWTLHPQYLDPQGLVALWREALLARAVLKGATRGYRHHPQLQRFQAQPSPVSSINAYLAGVLEEATHRGYRFDRRRFGPCRPVRPIPVTEGQLRYEWNHLLRKLSSRSPELYRRWRDVSHPRCHPLFELHPGPVEAWERVDAPRDRSGKKA